ncbi:MAG TPA: 6-hydroxymethylpterin diphosphokinase MptE-like protein [Candidatus Nitrosotenuis sp.]|nr:6-hydroxymethylpterin diphosphokinase MptE-like protein [Candidatus Nitrosotenuis sp.]
MISGWNNQYKRILKAFGYDKNRDFESAKNLDRILGKPISENSLRKLISDKDVFVIGSGPSLKNSIEPLKKHRSTTKICADSALEFLAQNRIMPQIVVTDLDGNANLLKKASKNAIMIVHAHGDNMERLQLAKSFKNYLGTTQAEKTGRIQNFGGFTDGDRCVFLASHFGASKIIMLGMDFGNRIGAYSNTKKRDRKIKLKKLRHGKMLLEWLATKTGSELFTLSSPLKGFKKINRRQLDNIIS